MDLNFRSAPEDLMTKFIGCLVLLPNLRTLEAFGPSRDGLPPGGLMLKSTPFPSICELKINKTTMELVGRCPNVEGLTVRGTLSSGGAALLGSCGKELKKLKRIAGVHEGAVKSGKLCDILVRGTRSSAIHHGSCAGLSGPPRNFHRRQNWVLRRTRCESPCRGPSRLMRILTRI